MPRPLLSFQQSALRTVLYEKVECAATRLNLLPASAPLPLGQALARISPP